MLQARMQAQYVGSIITNINAQRTIQLATLPSPVLALEIPSDVVQNTWRLDHVWPQQTVSTLHESTATFNNVDLLTPFWLGTV